MNRFSRDLMQGMKEAAEFAEGHAASARVHVVEVPDVRYPLAAAHVAAAFRRDLSHSAPDAEDWEQGRRAPDAPAAAHLQAISRQPKAIKEALQHG